MATHDIGDQWQVDLSYSPQAACLLLSSSVLRLLIAGELSMGAWEPAHTPHVPQAAITELVKLTMHIHRQVRESAVRALDMSFKRYKCLLPACIPTALAALARLPLPELPLHDAPSHLETLPALQQAMVDSAATSSRATELSAAGKLAHLPLPLHAQDDSKSSPCPFQPEPRCVLLGPAEALQAPGVTKSRGWMIGTDSIMT